MAQKVKRKSRYTAFSRFYDFFWFADEDNPDRDADRIFRILGKGNETKGRDLLRSWKQQLQGNKAQIHVLTKWKTFSDEEKKELDDLIKVLNPPRMRRPSD